MNRPRAYHTKPERERQTLYVIPSTWNLKYDTMNLSMKQKQNFTHGEQIGGCQGGGPWGRGGVGVWG